MIREYDSERGGRDTKGVFMGDGLYQPPHKLLYIMLNCKSKNAYVNRYKIILFVYMYLCIQERFWIF
jgi:hypothetical protein